MSSALAFVPGPPIPPSAKDLPYEDGEPMETPRHNQQMVILRQTLRIAWKDRQDYYVGGNMFLYFSELQVRKNDFRGPDLFVVLNTTSEDRLSWVVWAEDGNTPAVVIELLSPLTAAIDRGKKKDIYAGQMRVPFYYLFDPFTKEFEGFRLDPSTLTYLPLEKQPNGDLPCPILGLALGIRESNAEGATTGWLRWIDTDGNPLPTGEELAVAASLQAEAAQREAEAAQREAETAQREAETAQKEAKAARRDVEAAQKEVEAARRDVEAAHREAAHLEARLAEYEKKFGSL
jgi:Uma2 family endonuclease